MNKSTLRVSVFVPAHNEAKYIGSCIDSLLRQSVPPYEIIVVDNGSTDDTAKIVSSYGSVKLIKEKKPGILAARTTGFNSGKGDIIARLDADCKADTDWIEQIQHNFTEHPRLAAVSGPFYYYDMPAQQFGQAIEAFVRGELDRFSKNAQFLAGANMAIRRSAWLAVAPKLCQDKTIHEDLDIAIHLQRLHYSIRFDPQMVVGTSLRIVESSTKTLHSYLKVYEHTYNSHGVHSVLLKVPIMVYFPLAPIFKVVRRVYNPVTKRLSLKRLLFSTEVEEPVHKRRQVV